MAFSDAERAHIRELGGWPAKHFSTDDRLEQSLTQLAAKPEDETRIRGLITKLATIDTKLTEALDDLVAIQVCDIKQRGGYELNHLRKEGRRFVNAIYRTLGVAVLRNFYSTGSGPAPQYAGPYGPHDGSHYSNG